MGNFNYKDYCIGLAIGISFPQKFSIEDKLGEMSDYYIGKCSFNKRQTIETPSGIMLQLNKDLMELVIERNNFLGSYSFFYGDQIKENLFPGQDNNPPKVNLYGNPSKKYSKPFGILSLDVQTYYKPESILMAKLGGEEKIIDRLFNQAY